VTGPEPETGHVTTPSSTYVLPPLVPMDDEDWWLYREEACDGI
jgi:hypothetical protein